MTPVDRIPALPALPKLAGQANVPGLRKLWLIEARHVLGVTDPRTVPGNLTGWTLPVGGLQLSEEAQIIALTCRAALATYTQRSVTSPQGIAYAQSISLTLPRDNAAASLFVARMVGRKWVIICEDANGLPKLVGTNDQPLRAETAFGTNPNSHNLNWSVTTRRPATVFTEFDLLSITDAEFSFGFSTDFLS